MNSSEGSSMNAIVTPKLDLGEGVGVRFVMIPGEMMHKPEPVFSFEPPLTKKKIARASRKILDAMKSYTEQFGSDLDVKYQNVLLDLSRLHDQGCGYGELAKILNYRCLALLYRAFRIGDIKKGENTLNPNFFTFYTYFIGLGLGEARFNEEVAEGFRSLEDQQIPWLVKDGPFTRDRVRDHLEYFHERIDKGQLTIKPHPLDTDVNIEDMNLLLDGWFESLNEYIRRNDFSLWNRNKRWISKWLGSLSDAVYKSANPIIREIVAMHKNRGKK